MIKMFTLDEIINEIEASKSEKEYNSMEDVLEEVSDIIRDNEYKEITAERAIAQILNAVRPRATWKKQARGAWCFEYVCSGCGGAGLSETTTYCPNCGALMEE